MACRNLTRQFMDIRNANKANKNLLSGNSSKSGDDSADDLDSELLRVSVQIQQILHDFAVYTT